MAGERGSPLECSANVAAQDGVAVLKLVVSRVLALPVAGPAHAGPATLVSVEGDSYEQLRRVFNCALAAFRTAAVLPVRVAVWIAGWKMFALM